jgi:nitroimidazol reductase NimA-like FMN-containing flavoprotein (pyridoxamine 5'-phosphate oxidase superfamily)
MAPMTSQRAEEFLTEPHVAVLSVSRSDRGPLAVPVWYEYADGRIRIVTSPDSLHGRIVQQTGRATLTVRAEEYGDADALESYVMVEGPATFTDEDTEPIVRRIRRRYHRGPRTEDWVNRPVRTTERALLIEPQRIISHEWTEHL